MTSLIDLAAIELHSTLTSSGSSFWGEWQKCPHGHAIKYGKEAVTPKIEAAHFGIGRLLHAALAFEQRGVLLYGNQSESPHKWDIVLEAAVAAGTDLVIVDESSRLLSAYFAHYGRLNAGWPEEVEIVAVEQLLEANPKTIVSPYTARADAILKLHDRILIPDHKTRAAAIPKNDSGRCDWIRQQTVNPQFLGLSYLAREHYQLPDPPSIWVNAIIKTAVPKFDRILLTPTAEQLDEWQYSQTLLQLHKAATAHLPPVRHLTNCAPAIGGRCWAFEWCHGSKRTREANYNQTTETESEEN